MHTHHTHKNTRMHNVQPGVPGFKPIILHMIEITSPTLAQGPYRSLLSMHNQTRPSSSSGEPCVASTSTSSTSCSSMPAVHMQYEVVYNLCSRAAEHLSNFDLGARPVLTTHSYWYKFSCCITYGSWWISSFYIHVVNAWNELMRKRAERYCSLAALPVCNHLSHSVKSN